jgi:hypothetical protein
MSYVRCQMSDSPDVRHMDMDMDMDMSCFDDSMNSILGP